MQLIIPLPYLLSTKKTVGLR